MSRYIDADKVLKELHLNHKDVIYIDKNDTAKRIEKIQGIDIVRCKECKYCVPYSTCNGDWQMCMRKIESSYDVMLNDFCSYGERSE